MNRLAVGQSARAQQAHKVDNRIDRLHKDDNRFDRLRALHKTDTDTQSGFKIGPIVLKFYSGQRRHTADGKRHERPVILGLPRASSGRQQC